MYRRVSVLHIPLKLGRIETMFKVNHEDHTPKRFFKKDKNGNLHNFLSRNINLSKKKKRLRNVSKRKLNKDNQKLKIVTINLVNNLGKKNLPILISMPRFDKNVVNIIMKDKDVYRTAWKLKKSQVLLFL